MKPDPNQTSLFGDDDSMIQRLFDAELAEKKKQEGMRLASMNRVEQLKLARGIARMLAHRNGDVNADEVGGQLYQLYKIKTLGPAAGSIFKEACWQFTGRFVKSARTTNHSRLLRVWRYVG